MGFGIIYKVTNKINGKVYIGQTVRGLHERRRKHNYSKQVCHFHNAIRKYGKDSFKWEVLEECDTPNELNEMEFHYIEQFNSIEEGYNMVSGGGVMSGWSHSKETKDLLSKKAKLRHATKGHPNEGRKWSKEIRKRMGESKRGKKQSKQQREKHSRHMTGSGNPMYGISGAKAPASKKYVVIFPDGSEKVVHGLHKFCLENGLNSSCMVRCARGFYKQHKKYRCKYFVEETS
jgi:group I intron endonuclease